MSELTKNILLSDRLQMIFQEMYDSLGNFYIKDLQGCYICFNRNQLDGFGSKDIASLLGKTDFETPWAQYAKTLQKNDSIVIAAQTTIKILEVSGDHQTEVMIFTSHKQPFFHNGELVGVRSRSLEAPLSLLNNSAVLSNTTEFIDLKRQEKLILTVRQKETLFLLLKGHTAKDAAAFLFISHRTAEHHINAIKNANAYASLREIITNVRAV